MSIISPAQFSSLRGQGRADRLRTSENRAVGAKLRGNGLRLGCGLRARLALRQQDRIADLIGQVYDAVPDPDLWSGLAPSIAETLGSRSAVLIVQADAGPSCISHTANISEQALLDYETHYWKTDVWAQRAASMEMGRVVESQEVVSDEDLIRTEYYQDFSRKVDAFYAIGSIFPVSASEAAILAIHRPRTAGTHGAEAKELVGQFLPHLQRALQMRTRFAIAGIERQAALDGLERAGLATLVVERDGRIIYANSDAEMLLLASGGIRAFTGRLAVAGSAASSALTRLIREAVDTASSGNGETGAALPIPRDERLPLTALVTPFRPAQRGFGTPAPAAIIFIRVSRKAVSIHCLSSRRVRPDANRGEHCKPACGREIHRRDCCGPSHQPQHRENAPQSNIRQDRHKQASTVGNAGLAECHEPRVARESPGQ